MRSRHIRDKGICLFCVNAGHIPFRRTKVSETDLDMILAINGVEELTYHKISQSLVIIYDRALLEPGRLCSRLKKMFPHPRYVQKRVPVQAIMSRGKLRSNLDALFEKVDKRIRERIDRCRDLVVMMPIGAVFQPAKQYYRRVLAPTWLEFIWQLIVL